MDRRSSTSLGRFGEKNICRELPRPGELPQKAERDKRLHCENIAGEYIITPLVIETLDEWGREALLFSKEIGDGFKAATGDKISTPFLRQCTALEVQLGNVRMVLQALARGRGLSEVFHV